MTPVARLVFALVFALAFALLAGPAIGGPAVPETGRETASPPPPAHRVERQGIAVELAVEPLRPGPLREGEHARVSFRITDAHTGKPFPGLYPGAWMDRLPPAGRPEERRPEACRDKIEAFIGGSLLSQPEHDLNVYYVLALNEDPTITVVDPLFGFGNTKLLDLVELRGPGADWALRPDERKLFVALAGFDRVAVIDTASWDVELEIDTGPGPHRVVAQPDGRLVWVAYGGGGSGPSGLTAIDARTLVRAGDVALPAGEHDLAVAADGRHLFATSRRAGTVSVVDTAALEVVREVPAGEAPGWIAWSDAAGAAYAVDPAGGVVYAVAAEADRPPARIPVAPGIGHLGFAPGGRLGFVVQPDADLVHLIDAATNRVIQTADVEDGPDRVAFSDELAYVRHRGVDTMLMIPLDQVGREGAPVPVVDFPGGQRPPGRTEMPTPAAGIVQAPGATAVLLANAEDRTIYYYKEGMAAPMGHFRNYGHKPRAVLVVDRSLRETAPGTYETTVELRRAGRYDVALFLDAPRLLHCFPLEVEENPELAESRRRRPLEVELLTPHHRVALGEAVEARYRLTDAAGGGPKRGLGDLTAVAFPSPGLVQRRHPLTEIGDGLYELRFVPDEPGVWFVFVRSPSQSLPLQESPRLVIRVEAEAPAEAPAAAPAAAQGDPPARETSSTNPVGRSSSAT